MSAGPRRALLLLGTAAAIAACTGGGDAEQAAATGDPAAGEELYAANCAACHGEDLRGNAAGPSLLDESQGPSRLDDAAFRLAVVEGVQEVEGDYGPMPGFPALGDQGVADVLSYVRDQQAAAGID